MACPNEIDQVELLISRRTEQSLASNEMQWPFHLASSFFSIILNHKDFEKLSTAIRCMLKDAMLHLVPSSDTLSTYGLLMRYNGVMNCEIYRQSKWWATFEWRSNRHEGSTRCQSWLELLQSWPMKSHGCCIQNFSPQYSFVVRYIHAHENYWSSVQTINLFEEKLLVPINPTTRAKSAWVHNIQKFDNIVWVQTANLSFL